MSMDVRDNAAESRYELEVDGKIAIAAYRPRGHALAFVHTEVPEELEGQGIASRLVKGALADVRAKGLKIIPACEFVAAYVERHPEEQDLVAE
ncbi:GNAT family N-acetyltransferase [Sphingomonas sp. ID0503]|uniref:GNAT family N-acetyltransferase n=1 Tax=Sphingomonas sp. ID0503 TaxID=3399691 RepID=UPI003AFA6994